MGKTGHDYAIAIIDYLYQKQNNIITTFTLPHVNHNYEIAYTIAVQYSGIGTVFAYGFFPKAIDRWIAITKGHIVEVWCSTCYWTEQAVQ